MPGQKAPEEARREQILAAAYEVAKREGIAGLTLRAVAAEAKLSHGLVLFHFKRKEQLVSELLDRVVAETLDLRVSEEIGRIPRALDRFRALVRQEMDRLAHEPDRVRVLLECWALGAREPALRESVGAALERYRAAFRPTAQDVLRDEPAGFSEMTPDGLASVTAGLVHACAIQAMVDPERFRMEEYLAAVQSLVARLGAT
ncbi:MAG TPA: TetR/AcrR family transcriptional regulator [Longimicrobiales bacterium]|nr:TetR/AcrR family transcriptional regulator [Longimicrobiales bacterium]